MTETIDYAVSAIVIAVLMTFLLGLAPNVANPKVLLGTSGALTLAFSGFANTALVLVAAALFLAAATALVLANDGFSMGVLYRGDRAPVAPPLKPGISVADVAREFALGA